MSFVSDLQDGLQMENRIKSYFKNNYCLPCHRPSEPVGEYDLVITATIEVKFDKMATDTGNFAIEFENREEPSGIDKTLANLWLLGTREGVWAVGIGRLRRDLKENDWEKTKGGDDNASHMVLMDYQHIKDNYTQVIESDGQK